MGGGWGVCMCVAVGRGVWVRANPHGLLKFKGEGAHNFINFIK